MQVLDGKRRPSGGMVRLGTGARPSIFAQQQNRIGAGRVIDVIWNKSVKYKDFVVGYIEKGSFDLGGKKPEAAKIEAEQVPGAPVPFQP